MPWMLLSEKEQRKHLLNGVRGACNSAAWHQDTRAMCPEIVLSPLLKRNGGAFIDFTKDCIKGFKEVGAGPTYTLPNKWWDEAVDSSKPLTETTEKNICATDYPKKRVHKGVTRCHSYFTITHVCLSVLFILYVQESVFGELVAGSPSMDPIIDMMKSDPLMVKSFSEAWYDSLSRPVIRCENCSKTSEMIGGATSNS
jgi:hypothetical protein